MTPLGYGLVGARAANAYGREDTEPQRASDRLQQRIQQRRDEMRGISRPQQLGRLDGLAAPPEMQVPSVSDNAVLSTATKLTQPLVGAAGGLANILDLPGSMVRDVFALKNPLDQLLTPASAENRTTGEELAEKYGLFDDDPNAQRGVAKSLGRFAGGLGIEVALDPLTYLLGPLAGGLRSGSKGGMKALSKMGLVDDGLFAVNKRLTDAAYQKTGVKMGKREASLVVSPDDVIKSGTKYKERMQGSQLDEALKSDLQKTRYRDAKLNEELAKELGDEFTADAVRKIRESPLREGYYTFQLPYMPRTNVEFLKGDKAKKYARLIDTIEDKVRFGKLSPIMMTAPIWSKPVRGAKTPAQQRAALELSDNLLEAQAAARGKLYDATMKIQDSGVLEYPSTKGLSDAQIAEINERVASTSEAMFHYMEDIGLPRVKETIKRSKDGKISVSKAYEDGSVKYNTYTNADELRSLDKDTYLSFQNLDQQKGKTEIVRTYADDSLRDAWRKNLVQTDPYIRELEEKGLLDTLDEVKGVLKEGLTVAQRTGVDLAEYQDDFASYAARDARIEDISNAPRRAKGARANDPRTQYALARSASRRNIFGGTAALQRMSRQTEEMGGFAGIKERFTPDQWKEQSDNLFKRFLSQYGSELRSLDDNTAKQLFNEITSRPKSMASRGDGFYGINPAESALKNVDSLYQAAARAKGLREFLRNQSVLNTGEGLESLVRNASSVFGDEAVSGDRTVMSITKNSVGDIFVDNLRFLRKVGVVDQRGLDGPLTKDPRLAPTPPPVGDNLSPNRRFEDPLQGAKSSDSQPNQRNPGEAGDNDAPDFVVANVSDPMEQVDIRFTENGVSEAEYAQVIDLLRNVETLTDEDLKDATPLLRRMSVSPVKKDVDLLNSFKDALILKRPSLWKNAQQRRADDLAKSQSGKQSVVGQTASEKKSAPVSRAGKGESKKGQGKKRRVASENRSGIIDRPDKSKDGDKIRKVDPSSQYPAAIQRHLVPDGQGGLRAVSREEKKVNKSTQIKLDAEGAGVPVDLRRGIHWTGNDLVREAKARIDGTWAGTYLAKAREVGIAALDNLGQADNQLKKAVDILAGSLADSDRELAERLLATNRKLRRTARGREAAARRSRSQRADIANAIDYADEYLKLVDQHGINAIPLEGEGGLDDLRNSGIWSQALSVSGSEDALDDLRILYKKIGLDLTSAPSLRGYEVLGYDDLPQADKALAKLREFVELSKTFRRQKEKKQKTAASTKKRTAREDSQRRYLTNERQNQMVAGRKRAWETVPRPKETARELIFDNHGNVDYDANANWVPMPSLEPLVTAYRSAGRISHIQKLFGDRNIKGYGYAVPKSGPKEGQGYLLPLLQKRLEDYDAGLVVIDRNRDKKDIIDLRKSMKNIFAKAQRYGNINKSDIKKVNKLLGKLGIKVRPETASATTKTIAENVFKDKEAPKWLSDAITNLREGRFADVPEDVADFIYANWNKLSGTFPGKLDGVPPPTTKTIGKQGRQVTVMQESVAKAVSIEPPQATRSLYGEGNPQMGLLTNPANLRVVDDSFKAANDALNQERKRARTDVSAEDHLNSITNDMVDPNGDDVRFSDVANARQEIPELFDDQMARLLDEAADESRDVLGYDDIGPDFGRQPPQYGPESAKAAQSKIEEANKLSEQRKQAKKQEGKKGSGLSGLVDKNKKSDEGTFRLDQTILGESKPLGRHLFDFVESSVQTGNGRMGLLATHLNIGARGYDPILNSASEDFAALVQELKQPHQTYEDFLRSDIPQMAPIKAALSENNYIDTALNAARQQDSKVRWSNTIPLMNVPDAEIRSTLEAYGVNAPAGVQLNSPKGYDYLMSLARELSESGQKGSADTIASVANPLNDTAGDMLGSIYIDDYMNPSAVVETAQRLTGRNYLKEHGHTEIETMISEESQVFSHAVEDLRDAVSNLGDNGLDYGSRQDKREVFYQSVDEESILTEGIEEIEPLTRSMAYLNRMEDDAILYQEQLAWLSNDANVTPEESNFLGLSDLIADRTRDGKQLTAGELKSVIRERTPRVQIVDLGSTGRNTFSGFSVPVGNASTYTEILIRTPRNIGGRDNPIQPIHFKNKGLVDPRNPEDKIPAQVSVADNVLVHLRVNDYTNSEGKRLLLVQEVQSDILQDMRKRSSHEKRVLERAAELGISESEINGIRSIQDKITDLYERPYDSESGFNPGINAEINKLNNQATDYIDQLYLQKMRDGRVKAPLHQEFKDGDEVLEYADRYMDPDYVPDEYAEEPLGLRPSGERIEFEETLRDLYEIEKGPDPAAIPFSSKKTTYSDYGMKVAARLASDRGYDGVALIDGAAIAEAVGSGEGSEAFAGIVKHHQRLAKNFEKYMRKPANQFGAGAGPDYAGVASGVSYQPVRASNIRLQLYSNDPTPFGTEKMWRAGTITIPSHWGYFSDQQYYETASVWITHNDELDVYEVFHDYGGHGDSYPLSVKTIHEAKEQAANLINGKGDVDPEFDEYMNDLLSEMPPTDTTEFLFDDVTRRNIRQHTMYQGTPVGAKAAIMFPLKDIVDPQDWMKSQYKTLIVAYKQADPYSFVHEMGHLLRMSLRQIDSAMLSRIESQLGIENGNWKQLIIDPKTQEKVEAEEYFADAFMQWVKDGGKPQEGGLDGMWNTFKNFIATVHNKFVRGSEMEQNLRPEMHQFFDDLVGEQLYSGGSDGNLMNVLDKLKYTSARALNAMQDEIGQDDMVEAERAVLYQRLGKQRDNIVDDMRSRGISDGEGRVPTVDRLIDELSTKMEKMRRNGEKIPAKMKVGSGSGVMEVDTNVSIGEKLAQFRLDDSTIADVNRVYTLSSELAEDSLLSDYGDWYDAYTNTFKSNVTTVWPSFHFRNLLSGAIQNGLNDIFDPTEKGVKKFLKPYTDAATLMVGDTVEGLESITSLNALTAEQATEEIRKLAFRHGVFDSPGQHREIYGVGGVSSAIPGSKKMEGNNLRQKMMSFMRDGSRSINERTPSSQVSRFDSFNPLKVAGGSGIVDRFAPARVGRAAGDLVEGSHRMAGFIALIKQGYDPAEAAKRVRLLHVDYGDLTSTERNVLRRLFPFYSFSKGMSKYLANEIYTRPGGKIANTLRAANRGKSRDVTTPEYISQGVSFPIGTDEDGSRNFVTGLGLMHESVLPIADAVVSTSRLGPGKALFEAGGMLNPVPKVGLELMFNRSLFQEDVRGGGRLLDDMDPPIGRTLSNIGSGLGLTDSGEPVQLPRLVESLASNSPLSKAFSTARQVTDTRKGLLTKGVNTLTGVKVSKVSPQAQDQILRERASMLMNELGGRTFERDYIPTEVLESLSPEQREVADALREAQKRLADRAKARKAILEMQQNQQR